MTDTEATSTTEPATARPAGARVGAPPPAAARFARRPASWYLFGRSAELERGPVSKDLLGRRVVAFRTEGGRLAAMDARCAHLGADLGNGCVAGEAIRCPFHHWEYGPDGRCIRIPAQSAVPDFARQRCYPAAERAGFVFVFNGPEPSFPLPFFEAPGEDELVAAEPFTLVLDCPWYLVGANAFDLQHFRAAHDRVLEGPVAVDCPSPFARRAVATFAVCGKSWRDRLTRTCSGPRVEMSVTDWCGNLVFVTARFRRTTSYGMVSIRPAGAGGGTSEVVVVVFVRRRNNWLGRRLLDPVDLRVRRHFIREFLKPDAEQLAGAVYNPNTLVEADREMIDYFRWLAPVSHGLIDDSVQAISPEHEQPQPPRR